MTSIVSTPSPPDPQETASAQTGTNVATAIANAAMGHTNQYTPDGSITYNVTGYTDMTDQDGKTYKLPTYSSYQTLSGANQNIYDTNQRTKTNLANIGEQQTGKIGALLGTNADLSAENIDRYSNTHWKPAFDRQWAQQKASMEQQLADQGVRPGSEAYARAMMDFSTRQQAASDQYLGDMFDRSRTGILTERNQPINEISALMSGSQIQYPQQTNQPTTQLPTVDYAGIVNQNYQQQVANAQAANSGLFGLGSGLLSLFPFKSDRRLKTNVREVGTLANGLKIYEYSLQGGPPEIGVMADEAAQIVPDAVTIGDDGFARVNYGMIGF